MKNKEDEDKSQILIPKENIIKGMHHFEYISGTEAMCTKCPLGYFLTPGSVVKDGHIYIEETLVI